MARVAVAMSGGVDSSVAAALMVDRTRRADPCLLWCHLVVGYCRDTA
jgi:tRNA U34 2-thiouridine synthase MnmA/TrmU